MSSFVLPIERSGGVCSRAYEAIKKLAAMIETLRKSSSESLLDSRRESEHKKLLELYEELFMAFGQLMVLQGREDFEDDSNEGGGGVDSWPEDNSLDSERREIARKLCDRLEMLIEMTWEVISLGVPKDKDYKGKEKKMRGKKVLGKVSGEEPRTGYCLNNLCREAYDVIGSIEEELEQLQAVSEEYSFDTDRDSVLEDLADLYDELAEVFDSLLSLGEEPTRNTRKGENRWKPEMRSTTSKRTACGHSADISSTTSGRPGTS